MSVEYKIKQLIMQKGQITFDQMMREALSLHPASYYRSQNTLGVKGDFITSPEISQLFGEIIGLWCINQWQKIGSPKKVALVELGPGRGLLMRDALKAIKLVPDFYQALEIALIEINPHFIKHQKSNLKNLNLSINHYSSIENIPEIPSIIMANEFFDALPIKQYIKTKGLWHEVSLVMRGNSDKLKFSQIEINEALQQYFLQKYINAKDGAILEISNDSIETIKFINLRLKQFSGSALIIDYGYDINPSERTSAQYNSTVQAIRHHQYTPLLDNLGVADISAHVDFNALKTTIGYTGHITTQREFLIEYGILIRATALKGMLTSNQADIIERQVNRLISPTEMGCLFKVWNYS